MTMRVSRRAKRLIVVAAVAALALATALYVVDGRYFPYGADWMTSFVLTNAAGEDIASGEIRAFGKSHPFGRLAAGTATGFRLPLHGEGGFSVSVEFDSGRRLSSSEMGYIAPGICSQEHVEIRDDRVEHTGSESGQCRFATDLPCQDADISSHDKAYERIACDGARLQAAERWAEAARTFEAALKRDIHEFPNFTLYPRLALVYQRLGDTGKADAALERARLSTSVFVGAMVCGEEHDLRLFERRSGAVVDTAIAAEVAARMCGDLYSSYYEDRTFDSVLADAQLIETYNRAKSEIEALRHDNAE